ncbi:MAG: CoA activase [Candidatus Eisenbacteria sp.]|nr:CoA activase [Candidatus Eisenbacteria bacterium]
MTRVKHQEEDFLALGLDIGSVSVNAVVMQSGGEVLEEHYTRLHGQPIETTIRVLEDILSRYPAERFGWVGVTGTGGEVVAKLLEGELVNEIVAQTNAVAMFHPDTRTLIEMGGEDSKFLTFKRTDDGRLLLDDFAMNTQCAAGTGSFLDQQASRMGLSIEEEFAGLAMKSEKPPRIAGRCSVFAKSDMIHLQQIGTPVHDIVAGLCFAVARNFKSAIARGKTFEKPIAFHGGVAANQGLVRAFEEILDLDKGELRVPEHYPSMGAIGAALSALENGTGPRPGAVRPAALREHLSNRKPSRKAHRPLSENWSIEDRRVAGSVRRLHPGDGKVDCFIGVDVGSLSTNVVAIDRDRNVLARRYLPTAGRPLEVVKRGLAEIAVEIADKVTVRGAASTGSGRYLTGDFIGADIVRNEITAQARGAIYANPNVDTIFEIGGQDSKYISIQNGVVVDFEMNKVCAAGTGSFLEEQAEKLGINIVEEFGKIALSAQTPGRLGDRCTVFMESDLVAHQQSGMEKDNLIAGLAYSIVYNYLNKVVRDHRIGDHIFFQGGVASNDAVVAAFEKIVGKKITVPQHHDVMGAIGAAILAMEAMADGRPSRFHGFDLSKRVYSTRTFTCKKCSNVCEIRQIRFGDERPHFYGARCEIYEVDQETKGENLADLFEERQRMLLGPYHDNPDGDPEATGPTVGFPRVLHFYELFPFWEAFFRTLGFRVVLSETTNPKIIHESSKVVVAETCFPVKIVHGHVLALAEKGVDFVFLPSVVNMEQAEEGFSNNYSCPLVQAAPYIIQAAFDIEKMGTRLLAGHVHFQDSRDLILKELAVIAKRAGVRGSRVKKAMAAGEAAQKQFVMACRARGREILEELGSEQLAAVIVCRPYNGCDPGINLSLPKKLKDLGVLAIPMDFLTLDYTGISNRFPNMYWRYGQRILSAIEMARKDPRLNIIYISNFKCGPDSFIEHFVREQMGEIPYLELEIDEHSADAGAITRCEAFIDSVRHRIPVEAEPERAEEMAARETRV